MSQEFTTDDVKIEAEGTVTHGPGTQVITITVFKDSTPTDQEDQPIPLKEFAAWLTDMSDEWVIEHRTF